MKKRFLHFYDKIIIAVLVGVLGLLSCARRSYPEKQQEASEAKSDSLKISDTLRIIRDKFEDRVIAMYGVRPTEDVK